MSANPTFYIHELPENLEWVQGPALSLGDHLGKPVLLVFFCLSSIQSRLHWQDIKTIQARFKEQLVIIGVHTPKHNPEREGAFLAPALRKLALPFPVINDREWVLWRKFGIEAWPSTLLLDAFGKFEATFVGSGHRAALEERIHTMLKNASGAGLRPSGLAPLLAQTPSPNKLFFPSKLASYGDRLFIADSLHHRIVECSFQGQIIRTIGAANPGFWDGPAADMGMREPGGLCVAKEQLFICDTGNHAIRRMRLVGSDHVDTIAGTGKVGYGPPEEGSSRSLNLAAPTDCVFHQDKLYVTLAGQNQVWAFDLTRNTAFRVAGSGDFGLHDGSLMAVQMAGPTSITFGVVNGQERLFVLDTENSSLRQIRLVDLVTTTLIGENSFEFGDNDGAASFARLQHPTGMCLDSTRNVLWIADSYNNKIKVYSPQKNEIKTLNVNFKLDHPAGMTIADNALWIANEHAHELLRLDLKTGRLARIGVGE